MRPPFRITVQTSSRDRLLSTCAGKAALAAVKAAPLVLLSASMDGGPRADDCTAYGGYACFYVVQPSAPKGNQNPGIPGTPVGEANVNIPGVAYPAGQAILIQTIGGQGGTGYTNTSSEKEGADGGRGGGTATPLPSRCSPAPRPGRSP